MTERLLIGFEYNLVVSEVVPTVNWVANQESERWPIVTFGSSSDRIFSPEGTRAYFVTAAKAIPHSPVAPYVTISYSEWENRITIPFGVNLRLATQWDFLAMQDGTNSHLLLTWKAERLSASVLLVKTRFWGLSLGTRF